MAVPGRSGILPAQSEAFEHRLVTRRGPSLQVVQQAAPLPDHHQQAAPGMHILLVGVQVSGQISNPFGQDRDLYLGRAGVLLGGAEFLDQFPGPFACDRHCMIFCLNFPVSQIEDAQGPNFAGLVTGDRHRPTVRHSA